MCENKKKKTSQPKAGAEGATEKMERDGGVVGAEREGEQENSTIPNPPHQPFSFPVWYFSVVGFLWNSNGERQKKKNRLKKETSDLGRVGGGVVAGGGLLRKRPAIYVLVLCKYYMSSTFAQLFAITSTGWVYYFRNHALFMEQHDLLPHTPLSLSLLYPLSLPHSASFSLSSPLSICKISTARPCWTITRQRDPNGDVCRKQHVYN